MATKFKRVTFAITPELETLMDKAKKTFYDHNLSDMIRKLILAGIEALNEKADANEKVQ